MIDRQFLGNLFFANFIKIVVYGLLFTIFSIVLLKNQNIKYNLKSKCT